MRADAPPNATPNSLRPVAKVCLAAVVLLGVAGCDGYPKDIEETTEHVLSRGTVRAGIVETDSSTQSAESDLAKAIAQAVGAQAALKTGSGEVLLHGLETGELDVVVGEFAKGSPWSGRVALTLPTEADDPESGEPVIRAAVPSGENRWLILVSGVVKKEGAK